MTRHIIVAIEPHEDGKCAGCDNRTASSETAEVYCGLFGETLRDYKEYGAATMRCQPCLAAEAKLTALIEAGEAMRGEVEDGVQPPTTGSLAWDRAVAEAKK